MTTPTNPAMQGTHPAAPTGPIPVIDSAPSGSLQASRSRTPILLTVIGALVVALGVVTALWISASNQLSAIELAKAATPNLIEVAERNLDDNAFVTGDADSASVVILKYDMTAAEPGLRALLDELGFSSAVLDRIGKTRALDGTLEAQGDNCNVTWTYHPDDGLQMVFEAVPPT